MAFWISAFYFPQGFLTSVLQGHSRASMIPVDQLSFEFQLEDTADPDVLEEAPNEGIYIHGIFMDGAGWDYTDMVVAPQEFGVMYMRAPIVNMIPMQDKVVNTDKFL